MVQRQSNKLESKIINIEYNEIGYVKDDDAGDIDYDELLKGMQDETAAANKQRTDAGFELISVIGRAASPCYDKLPEPEVPVFPADRREKGDTPGFPRDTESH